MKTATQPTVLNPVLVILAPLAAAGQWMHPLSIIGYLCDHCRWHVNENIFGFDLAAAVLLWETFDGQLAIIKQCASSP